jgi:hypothetical protein
MYVMCKVLFIIIIIKECIMEYVFEWMVESMLNDGLWSNLGKFWK